MEINADFTQRVALNTAELEWAASPMPGVERRMLDRVGEEVARATSIVRYAPGSAFSAHVHAGGEEYLVLEGVFQDEHGNFPVGSYVRNPPQSSHTPASAPGCTIFVKLWQFDPNDRTQVHVDTTEDRWQQTERAGVLRMPLFADSHEVVCLERWAPGLALELDSPDGLELLVLDGDFRDGADQLRRHGWLRMPAGSRASIEAGDTGARVWVKRGHLVDAAQHSLQR